LKLGTSINIRQTLLTGIFWNLSDKLITQVGYLLVTLYLAKLIGPEAFGLIGMLTIFTLLTESIVSNAFSQALIQRSASLSEAESSTIFYVTLAWGALIYAGLYFSAPFI
jgi:O-antigen/teichoic acid export membrane protein